MSANIGYATLSIIPSAKGFGNALQGQVAGPMAAGGAAGGRDAVKGARTTLIPGLRALGPLAAVGIGAGIVKGVGDATGAASDLNESINAINVAYGESAEGILDLSDNAARGLGLTSEEFNSLAVRFSGFSSNIVGEGGDVVGFIDELTGRGTDFASVFNLDVDEALGLFQSGLAGETEPLRRFGIDLSAAAVESYALAEGIASGTGPLTEAEKQQARYGLLLQETSDVQGDFANTSDGLANQQRIMAARWGDLQAAIGQAFIPVAEKLAGVLNSVLGWTLDLVNGLGGAGGAGGLGGAFASIQGAIAPVVGFFRGTLLPIFQETVASVRDSLTPIFATLAQVWRENILPALGRLFEAWSSLWPAIETVYTYLATAFGWFIQVWAAINGRVGPVVLKLAGWLFENLVGALATAIEWVGNIIGFLVDMGVAFVDRVQDVAEFVSGLREKFQEAVEYVRGVPGRIVDAMGDLRDWLYDAGTDFLQGFIDGIGDKVGGVISAATSAVSEAYDGVLRFLGIRSPSRLMMEVGRQTTEGFIEGVGRDAERARSALTAVVTPPDRASVSSLDGPDAPASGETAYNARTSPMQVLIGEVSQLRAEVRRQTDRQLQLTRTGALR